MNNSLIYIHIGDDIPIYIYDSIYQSILINTNTKIYVILSDKNINVFLEKINNFNINIYKKHNIDFFYAYNVFLYQFYNYL